MVSRIARASALAGLVGIGALGCDSGAPPDGPWPNEPAGFTVYTDWGMDSVPPTVPDALIPGSALWHARTGPAGDADGWAELVADASAPRSPSSVYSFVYPTGMVDGSAPANVWVPLPDFDEVYVGFWWKVSDPWQYHNVGDKVGYLWSDASNMFLIQSGSPPRLFAYVQFSGSEWLDPNVQATTITRGVWHRVELYAHYIPGQKVISSGGSTARCRVTTRTGARVGSLDPSLSGCSTRYGAGSSKG